VREFNPYPSHDVMEIYTLGSFQVKLGTRILTEEFSHTKKCWDLFKFLLLNQKKNIPAESILEQLWPHQEYSDPKRALRIQIHRLRQILMSKKPGAIVNGDEDHLNNSDYQADYIKFSHGCYHWNSDASYWFDVEEFVSLYKKAQNSVDSELAEKENIYRQMLELYKGDFLSENSYSEWVIAARNHFRHIYLKSVLDLLEILKKKGNYTEVLEICETALQVEFFEEELHLNYMEALLKLDKYLEARTHYQYMKTAFYRELGTNPSENLEHLYRLSQSEKEKGDFNLSDIHYRLRIKEMKGAMLCSPESFRLFYYLEQCRLERANSSAYLALLTLNSRSYHNPSNTELNQAGEILKNVLLNSLRKGDVITAWNNSQYLVILSGLKLENAEKVAKRIEKNFISSNTLENFHLQIGLQPLEAIYRGTKV